MSEVRMIDANKLKNDVNAQVSILNALSVSTGIDELRQIGEELQRGMFAEIDKQPTVDAVPVVQCGECAKWKHEKTESHDFYRCEKGNHWSKKKYDDWFCADGERQLK